METATDKVGLVRDVPGTAPVRGTQEEKEF